MKFLVEGKEFEISDDKIPKDSYFDLLKSGRFNGDKKGDAYVISPDFLTLDEFQRIIDYLTFGIPPDHDYFYAAGKIVPDKYFESIFDTTIIELNQDSYNKIIDEYDKVKDKPRSQLFGKETYMFKEKDFTGLKTDYVFDIPTLQKYKDNVLYVSYLLLNHFFDFDTTYKEVNVYFHSIDKTEALKIINELFVKKNDIKYTKYKEFIEIYTSKLEIYRFYFDPYETIADILLSQPVDSMGIGTDGERSFMTRRFIDSIIDGRNVVNSHLTQDEDEVTYMRNLALAGYGGIQAYTGFDFVKEKDPLGFIIDDNFRNIESLYYFDRYNDQIFKDKPYISKLGRMINKMEFDRMRKEKFNFDLDLEGLININTLNGFYSLFGWYINNIIIDQRDSPNYIDETSEIMIEDSKEKIVVKHFQDVVIDDSFMIDESNERRYSINVGVDYKNGESYEYIYDHKIRLTFSRNIIMTQKGIRRESRDTGELINFLPIYNRHVNVRNILGNIKTLTDHHMWELTPSPHLLISEDHVTTYYTLDLLL